MVKLLKIELKKIMTYKVFWILMGLYFLFLVLGILMAGFTINNWIDNINKHSPIPFPHVHTLFLSRYMAEYNILCQYPVHSYPSCHCCYYSDYE